MIYFSFESPKFSWYFMYVYGHNDDIIFPRGGICKERV